MNERAITDDLLQVVGKSIRQKHHLKIAHSKRRGRNTTLFDLHQSSFWELTNCLRVQHVFTAAAAFGEVSEMRHIALKFIERFSRFKRTAAARPSSKTNGLPTDSTTAQRGSER
jgi:hypothetical protein